jgi:hypothetical protein
MRSAARFVTGLGSVLALSFGAASCGSDSDSSAPTAATAATAATPGAPSTEATPTSAASTTAAGDVRGAIVDYTVDAAAAAGFQLDQACIADLVGQLSDDDAALLAASIDDASGGDPQLSAEGEALGNQVFEECVVGSDDQALIDEVITKVLADGGEGIDEACVRENVPKLNDEQLRVVLDSDTGATGPQSTDPQLQNAALFLLDCLDISTSTTG